jgi:hypothetical protein
VPKAPLLLDMYLSNQPLAGSRRLDRDAAQGSTILKQGALSFPAGDVQPFRRIMGTAKMLFWERGWWLQSSFTRRSHTLTAPLIALADPFSLEVHLSPTLGTSPIGLIEGR